MYRRYRKRKTTGNVLPIIIGLILLTNIFDLIDIAFELLGVAFGLGILALPFVGFGAIVAAIVKAAKNKNKAQSPTMYSQTELIRKLQSYFVDNTELAIDSDSYLVRNKDANANTLDGYDIYVNGEYISSLKLLANAFPSGFNTVADHINSMLSKRNTSVKINKKKQQTPVTPEVKPEPAKPAVQNEKDINYFIKTLNEQNRNIPHEKITESLNNTVEYLQTIKKIEDEFPECKNKTTKLYQYYLPMLTDILANYHRLMENGGNAEELSASEDRLIKTIILINNALKIISASLTEDYYTDLNVDMKTLQSILKKDGLIDELAQMEGENNER